MAKRKPAPAAPLPSGWCWGGGDQVETLTWLWEPWIPDSALTLIAGKSQKGKSTLLAHLAAGVTLRPYLRGKHVAPPDSVLWIAGEESWGAAALPRLLAAGANYDRIIHPTKAEEDSERLTASVLARELPALHQAGVRLVVIDPLAALCEEGSDWITEGGARQTLDVLQQLAGDFRVPIICTRNWNKKSSADRLERISGSHAFRDVPRAILSCIDDPLVKGRYVLCLDKWSYGPGATPICYDLDRSGDGGVPVWRQLGECRLDSDDLEDERPRGGARTQWRAAHTLLRACVPQEGIESKELQAEAKACGVAPTTLWRAATELGVVMRRQGFGRQGRSMWYPPRDGWPDDLPCHEIRGKEGRGGVSVGKSERDGADETA